MRPVRAWKQHARMDSVPPSMPITTSMMLLLLFSSWLPLDDAVVVVAIAEEAVAVRDDDAPMQTLESKKSKSNNVNMDVMRILVVLHLEIVVVDSTIQIL